MLKVGTDCSGIEAPIQALLKLGIKFRHCFSSEIDKKCIQSIQANYNPEILFGLNSNGNIVERNHSELPEIDLYVCGFPCQSFSPVGKREGLGTNNGNVFRECIDVIKEKQPNYFVLENVKGILWHDKKDKQQKYGKTWEIIWNELKTLETIGYNIDFKVLNTRDYGIPQNRERIYIVGDKTKPIVWPEPIAMEKLSEYIDYSDTNKYTLQGGYNSLYDQVPKDSIFADAIFSGRKISYKNSNRFISCINTKGAMYNIAMHRYANTKEYLKLQGFPEDFNIKVSNCQLKKQVGNSMSVNVLVAIFKHLLE